MTFFMSIIGLGSSIKWKWLNEMYS